jgi:hypothetical protein
MPPLACPHLTNFFASPCTGPSCATPQKKWNLADSIAELREMAAGRDDVLAEAAGIEAGSWLHGPQRMSDTSSLLPNVDHSRRKQRHAGLWNWSVGHGSATCGQ